MPVRGVVRNDRRSSSSSELVCASGRCSTCWHAVPTPCGIAVTAVPLAAPPFVAAVDNAMKRPLVAPRSGWFPASFQHRWTICSTWVPSRCSGFWARCLASSVSRVAGESALRHTPPSPWFVCAVYAPAEAALEAPRQRWSSRRPSGRSMQHAIHPCSSRRRIRKREPPAPRQPCSVVGTIAQQPPDPNGHRGIFQLYQGRKQRAQRVAGSLAFSLGQRTACGGRSTMNRCLRASGRTDRPHQEHVFPVDTHGHCRSQVVHAWSCVDHKWFADGPILVVHLWSPTYHPRSNWFHE